MVTDHVEGEAAFSIINYQPTEIFVELIDNRSRITDVFECVYFNEFVKSGLRKSILKRIIVNGLTGNSWRFKRFNRLSVNVKKKTSKTAGV